MSMITNSAADIIERLIEGGLEEKYARIILALCGQPPMKASEIGKLVSISRMDAYNSLKKLKEMGLKKWLVFVIYFLHDFHGFLLILEGFGDPKTKHFGDTLANAHLGENL